MEARLEALRALLGGALKIVADLERHPLFVRLLDRAERMADVAREPEDATDSARRDWHA